MSTRWALLVLLAPVIAAAPPDQQIAHLAGLARAWGQVKYVHPAMASSDADWDAALVRAIAAVEAATSDEEYRGVIASMLAELGDPATRVVEPSSETASQASPTPDPKRPWLERIDERTSVVVVPGGPALEANPDVNRDTCARFEQASVFDRVVLDLRGLTGRRAGWSVKEAISKCLPRLLDRDVALPPRRFLNHGFYGFQSIAGGPGGVGASGSSQLTVSSSGAVRGEARRTPRLAVIVNAGTPDICEFLMALQAHGLAYVVQQGAVRDAGLLVKTFEVEDGLTIAVRHGELLRPDGGAGFAADEVVPGSAEQGSDPARAAALRALERPRRAAPEGPAAATTPFRYSAFIEKDYSHRTYPDRAHRLLALFRLYNVIEYFFPYKDLMDRPWRDTLREFIPRMRDARDETDYALAVCELATRLNDSHVTVHSPVLDAYFGTDRPPVRVDLVEASTVVTEIDPDLAGTGLLVGDIVLSVDGEATSARRARLARYLPASTPGRLENKIDIEFLLGPKSQPAVLEVRGEDGALRHVAVPRTLEGLAPRARRRAGPVYRVLADGYGYVDLERLKPEDVDAAFETIRRMPGLILDMRGYPTSAAWLLVPRLARDRTRPAFLSGDPRYDGSSGQFWLAEGVGDVGEPVEAAPGERYAGRVVVLADGSSQSAAETVCLLVKAVTDPTFVGTRTSGANGGVTRTILPGGIVVNFTGYAVRNADGSQFQRIGIVPDIEARPTLRSIREGRDELVERAVEFLSRSR